MRIRNITAERRLVPSLHIEADPGQTVYVRGLTPERVPDGFEQVTSEPAPAAAQPEPEPGPAKTAAGKTARRRNP